MDKDINLHGKKYISARRASEITGYSSDYVGQMCRSKKIDAKLIGRSWYVSKKDILKHKNSKKSYEDISKKLSVISRRNNSTNDKKIKIPTSKVFDQAVFKPRSGYNKITYFEDNSPLFPIVVKKVDQDRVKYVTLKSLEDSFSRPKRISFVERFAINTALVSFALILIFAFTFGRENVGKLISSNFINNVGKEISFLSGPHLNNFQNGYAKFKENVSNINQSGNQLASSVFSLNGLQSVSGWIKETTYKIIKPWLSKEESVLVDNSVKPSQTISQTSNTAYGVQARTVVVGADKSYVDTKIEELKNYFLNLPLTSATFPNVNRHYITNQNDSIVDLIGRSSGSSSSSSGGGASALSDLSDLTLASLAYGDVLLYNGIKWVNAATSSLGIIGVGGGITGIDQLGMIGDVSTSTLAYGHVLIWNGSEWQDVATTSLGISGGAGVWGGITGTLSAQTDLQEALNGKIEQGTTSVNSITTLSNLSITQSQVSDFGGPYLTSAVTSLNGLTDASQIFATTSNSGSWGFSTTTGVHTLNIPIQNGSEVLGLLSSANWNTFNSKLSSYDAWTHPAYGGSATTSLLTFLSGFLSTASSTIVGQTNLMGNVGIGTSSPYSKLSIWGGTSGNILEAITNSSSTALSVSATGFGTTTVTGLNINGSATSTSNVGFNITTGCYAINGTCVGGSSSFTNTLANGGTATTTFYNGGIVFASSTGAGLLSQSSSPANFFWDETNKRLGLGTSTPFAKLSVNSIAGEPAFVIGSSTATSFIVDASGRVGVGNIAPSYTLDVTGTVAVSGQTYFNSQTNMNTAVISPVPDPASNSYSNPGGSGDRTSSITVTDSPTSIWGIGAATLLVDGLTNAGRYWRTGDPTGRWASFDLGVPRLISEIKLYISNNGSSKGYYKWQASTDNSTWEDKSDPVEINYNGTNWFTMTTLTGTGTYRYWRIIGTSGSAEDWGWLGEFQFKISADMGSTLALTNYGMSYFDGKVGIGTSSPLTKLSIQGTSGANDILNVASSTGTSLMYISSLGNVGIGTTTPSYVLNPFSSSAPQLALSAGAGILQWAFRNAGGNLYLSTTTVAGNATTSISALEIAGGGFGTTTIRGLNISGQATSTSNVGFNITTGCYAVNGTCVGGGSATLTGTVGQLAYFSGTDTAVGTSSLLISSTGNLGIGTTTDSGYFATSDLAGLIVSPNTPNILNNTRPAIVLQGKYDQGTHAIGDIRINASDATTAQVNMWAMSFRNLADFGGGPESLSFYFDRNGTSFPAMSLLNNQGATFFGNVGVGTTSPYAKLSIENTAGGNTPLFTISSSTNGIGTSTALYVASNGNVGIGTTNPGATLDIRGDSASLRAANASAGTTLLDVDLASNTVGVGITHTGNNNIRFGALGVSGEAMRIDGNGNVGIGTTSPYAKLSIEHLATTGTVIGTDALTGFTGSLLDLKIASTTKFSIDQTGKILSASLAGSGDRCLYTDENGNVLAKGTDCGSSGGAGGTWATTTSTVTGQFINFPNNDDDIVAIGSNSTTTAEYWFDPTAGVSYLSGNVGIGIVTPGVKLDVRGNAGGLDIANFLNATVNTDTSIYIGNSLSAGRSGRIAFNDNNDTTSGYLFLGNYGDILGTGGLAIKKGGSVGIGTTSPFAKLSVNSIAGEPAFVVGSSTATSFIVDASGNVGIGTTSPTTALEVNGGITGSYLQIGTSTPYAQNGAIRLGNNAVVYARNAGNTADVKLLSYQNTTALVGADNKIDGTLGVMTSTSLIGTKNEISQATGGTIGDAGMDSLVGYYNYIKAVNNGAIDYSYYTSLLGYDNWIYSSAGTVSYIRNTNLIGSSNFIQAGQGAVSGTIEDASYSTLVGSGNSIYAPSGSVNAHDVSMFGRSNDISVSNSATIGTAEESTLVGYYNFIEANSAAGKVTNAAGTSLLGNYNYIYANNGVISNSSYSTLLGYKNRINTSGSSTTTDASKSTLLGYMNEINTTAGTNNNVNSSSLLGYKNILQLAGGTAATSTLVGAANILTTTDDTSLADSVGLFGIENTATVGSGETWADAFAFGTDNTLTDGGVMLFGRGLSGTAVDQTWFGDATNPVYITGAGAGVLINPTGGNVGIGTTSPYSKLSIWGGTSGNILEVVTSASSTTLSVSATGFGTTTVTGLNINGSATSTSNVGFNITTGCYAIDGTCVGGGGTATLTGTTGQLAYFSDTNTAVGTSTLFISTAGNVGIGTTSPVAKLDVNGSVQIYNQTPTTGLTELTLKAGAGQGDSPSMEFQDSDGTIKAALYSNTGLFAGAGYGIYGVTSPLAGGLRLGDTGQVAWGGFTESGLVDRTGWTAYVTNYLGGYPASSAIDGNTSTFWVSSGASYPLEIWVDMGEAKYIDAIKYSPRQDGTQDRFGEVEVYLSDDGVNWGSSVATATWANDASQKTITFTAQTGRWFKLKALSGAVGSRLSNGSCNEIYAVENLTDDVGLARNASGALKVTNGSTGLGTLIAGNIGIGTTTPSYILNPFSSSASQLSLSAGAGINQWAFRNAGGNLYLSTTTVAGTATTSISALEIAGDGFGTTTLRGLNISGQATSTSNVGFNITTGCYAVNGTCVGGGSSFTNTLANGGTATTTFYNGGIVFASSTGAGLLSQSSAPANFFWDETNKRLGLGTSTPFAKLSVNSIVGEPAFVIGSSTATSFIVDANGNVGVGTVSPGAALEIAGQLKMTGGTPGANKVLVSDASGLSSWKDLSEVASSLSTTLVAGETLLDSTAPAGGQTSFTVSDIPAGYSYIEIIISGKTERVADANGQVQLSFNSDTTNANYRSTGHYNFSGTHGVSEEDSRLIANIGSSSTNGGGTRITIINPSETTSWKLAAAKGATRFTSGANLLVELVSLSWENTAAITGILLDTNDGADFAEGTRVTIVGYKEKTVSAYADSSQLFINALTGNVGIGTTTPTNRLTIAGTSSSQLSLSAGAGINQWAFRNAGGNLYLSTTTVAGTATTSISALEIAGDGFGTTTLRGLNISGQATSTSNVGLNITTGCYAVNGTCVGGGVGGGWDAIADIPLAKGNFIVGDDAGVAQATSSLLISSTGNLGIGTTTDSGYFNTGDLAGLIVSPNTPNILNNTRPAIVLQGKYDQGAHAIGDIRINASDATTAQVNMWAMSFRNLTTFGGGPETLSFYFDRNGTSFPAMSLLNNQDATFFGNVGIGTTSPYAKLSISNYSDGANATPLFVVASSTGTGATSTVFTIDSFGNVGIGTTTPNAYLTIQGNGGAIDQLILADNGGNNLRVSVDSVNSYFQYPSGNLTFFVTPGSDVLTLTNNGNISIGTTSPYSKLSVWGGTSGNILEVVTSASSTALSVSATGFGTTTVTGLNISGSATSTSNVGFNITTGCYAVNGTCVGGGSSFTNTLANGGTATTTFYNGGIIFASSTGAGLLSQSSSPANFFWDETNKRLGLGTAVPGAKLDVNLAGTATLTNIQQSVSSNALALSSAYGSSNDYHAGLVWYSTDDNPTKPKAGIWTQNTGTGSKLFFGTSNTYATGITNTGMVIDMNGKVGIGTADPLGALHVVSGVNYRNLGAGQLQTSGGSNAPGLLMEDTSSNIGALTYWAGQMYFYNKQGAGDVAASDEIIRVDTSSNVGINTSGVTLDSKFVIKGTTSDATASSLNVTDSSDNSLLLVKNSGNVGIGTTTPTNKLTITDTANPQLTLSAGAGVAQWAFRNAGGNFYLGTTTVAGNATTSISALEIAGDGFGTTTVRGLNISAQATSTSNVGFNVTTGCYAVNGTCVGSGTGSSQWTTSGSNIYYNDSVAIGTTTPIGKLYIEGSVTGTGANAVAGIYGTTTLNANTNGGFLYGNRFLNTVGGTASSTIVGTIIRMTDRTTNDNTVRGLEVQAYSGNNTSGINTGIATYGKTFGLQAYTDGLAGAKVQPAAVFAELGHPTSGNAIRAYSSTSTTAALMSLYQETSVFTGTALSMDLGNGGGSFNSGNFISLKKAGSEKFSVDSFGSTTVMLAVSETGNFALCHNTNGAGFDTIKDCDGAPGADYQEMYPTDGNVEWGDITVASKTDFVQTNKGDTLAVLKKATGTDRRVILGIASNPEDSGDFNTIGYNLATTSHPYPIALKGRVKVKISLENGPIEAGDYLTLSSQLPGYATKALDSGVVIGQALEPYNEFSNSTSTPRVMTFVNIGWQNIIEDNKIVLGSDTGVGMPIDPNTMATSSVTLVVGSLLINQNSQSESGNILQLQTNDQDKFLVATSGLVSILADTASSTEELFVVSNASSKVLVVNARGDIRMKGTIVFESDSAAGSIATDATTGLAEVDFGYSLGTGKPVVQLTPEGDMPTIAQVTSWKKDSVGNYIGFIIKTFGLNGQSLSANVHYAVFGKQDRYTTRGEIMPVLTNISDIPSSPDPSESAASSTPPTPTASSTSPTVEEPMATSTLPVVEGPMITPESSGTSMPDSTGSSEPLVTPEPAPEPVAATESAPTTP